MEALVETCAQSSRRRKASIKVLIETEKHHPCRSPDWRWRLAGRLVLENRRLPGDLADPHLVDAVRLNRTLVRCSTQRKRTAFESREAAFANGLALHSAGGADRDLLEAWILTGEAPDIVASKCSLPVAVVAQYEALFFDVRAHLRARDWLLRQAIRFPLDVGVRRPAIGDLWRLTGAQYGPVVLESLLAAVPNFNAIFDLECDLTLEKERTNTRMRLLANVLQTNELPVLTAVREMLALVHKIKHDQAVNRDVKEALAPTAVAWEAAGNPRPPVNEPQSAVPQPGSSAKLGADAA